MKHSLRIADKQDWKRWRALPLLLAIALTFVIVATVSAAVAITATKTYTIIGDDGDGKADPGETIQYTVGITNTGTDATGVTFNDIIDANTTLVAGSVDVSPLAIDDSYETIGNTLLDVGAGAADPAVHVSGNLFTNDAEFLGDTFDASHTHITAHVGPSNGTLTLDNNTGAFTYLPNANFTGSDSFTYTLTDSGGLTDTATVTINVAPQKVWYVKNDAGAGDGRSASPFNTLAAAQTASAANDTIYVFVGDATATNQNAGITLKNGQRLLGEGVALTVPVALVQQGVVGSNPTTLRAAGSQPQIGNTGGDGVTVSGAAASFSGVEIRGLNIAGSAKGINILTSSTFSGSFEVANNTIRAAGTQGIGVSGGGSGTLTVNLHDNTVTATGNGIDIQRTAGSVNIIAFNDNVVTGNTGGIGINIIGPSVTFDATPSGSFNTVSGGTTIIGQSGNGVGASGMVLTNVSGDLSFTDLDIVADGGAGLRASGATPYTGSAGFQIAVGAGVATVAAIGGPAVDLNNVKANSLPFSSISSVNSPTTGVALNALLGAFSAGSGSSISNVTSAAGASFQVGSSNASITYNGTINATTGKGVDLTNNTGSTISFTGQMTLSTGTNTAFNATGGGTVNVTQNNTSIVNTLTTTTGTALDVANTTIGASGLTFRSITSTGSGAANAIILDTTGSSGGLTVSGNGGACTSSATCTGGTIANKTGADGSTTQGSGIYLNNTSNVSLTRMQLNDFQNFAIRGTSVTGLTLDNMHISGLNGDNVATPVNEGSISFDGLFGTTSITNSDIRGGRQRNIRIVNSSGTGDITITGNTIRDSSTLTGGDDNLFIQADTTAAVTAHVENNTFKNSYGDQMQVNTLNSATMTIVFTGNFFSTADAGWAPLVLGGGVTISGGNAGSSEHVSFNISNNGSSGSPLTGTIQGGALNINEGNGGGIWQGQVSGNWIGDPAITNSGSAQSGGIRVENHAPTGTLTSIVDGNNVRQWNNGAGINFQVGDTGNVNGVLNLTVTNNNVNTPGASSQHGIVGNFGADINGTNAVCVDTKTNTVNLGAVPPNGGANIRLRQRNGSTVRLPGYVGPTNGTGATGVVAFESGQNTLTPAGNVTFSVQAPGGGFVGGATCAQPTVPLGMVQNNGQFLAQHQTEGYPMAYAHASSADSNSANSFTPAYDLGSMYQPAAWVTPNDQSVSPPIAMIASDSDDRKTGLFAPPPAPTQLGPLDPDPILIGTLPAGKSVTIKFRVTVDPLGPGEIRTRILNQGNVTYTGGAVGGLDTTDPTPNADPACTAAPAIGTQTCTPVDLPDTTVSSINRQTPLGANTNASAVTWRVTFADAISGLTSSNFTLLAGGTLSGTSITSVTAVGAAPSTQWDVLVNTGTGDGLLELNMTSAAGLSHDVTNLPFTSGEDYTIDRTAPTVSSIKRQSPSSNPTNADLLVFRVTFNEPVTSVGANSFVATGTTTTIDSSVTNITPNLIFDFTVDGTANGDLPNLNGTVGLDVASSPIIKDLAGNTLQVVEPSPAATNDQTYTMDNTAPTVTNVSSTSADGAYTTGALIPVTVTFSEPVTVVGTPQLTLETGTTDEVVNYSSGSGTTTLTFNYTVQAGDSSADLDYLSTTALALNGGTIQDAATNDATLTLLAPGAAGSLGANKALVIDTTAPTVTNVTSTSADGAYTTGALIPITVTFSEPVTVIGTPQLTLETGTTNEVVDYTSGSGTDTLTFNYTVQAGDSSADLDYISTTALALNGGTIRDAATNDATLTLPAAGAAGSLGANKAIVIDTAAPTVTNVTSTKPDGTYGTGVLILVTVTFNEPVTVTGIPQLTLETGTTDEVVNYTSGSGTDTLTFTYTTQTGDTSPDLDYVGTTSLVLNGGTIRDAATNNATLTLPAPGAAGSLGFNKAIVIDATEPYVTNVTSTAPNGSYSAGAVIPITVQFSEAVTVIGTPQLTLETGATDAVVNYASGSGTDTLTFNYTVVSGNNSLDLDYVGTTSLALNGGTIKDASSNDAILTLPAPGTAGSLGANKAIVIDTIPPIMINNVTSSAANGSYTTGAVIPISITYSEVVFVSGTPQLTLETGATDRVVDYSSGSGTDTLTFNYTVQAGDTSADLDYISTTALALNGGTIQDAATNNAILTLPAPGASGSLGATKNIVIDTTAPTVTNVSSTSADGTYTNGAVIPVTVTFSEPVTVIGTPQLTLETGTTDEVVNYTGGSGTDTLTFNYTVQAGDTSADLDYISATALALNGGTIQDAATNDATLTLPAPGAAGSLGANKALVIDTTAPTVTNVTSTKPDGAYITGAVIPVTVTFSEPVTVIGTPQLTLETGTTDEVVNYTGGSGTDTLTFNYTVQAGDSSADLDYISTTALALNGGTITDAATNNATLTLPTPGAAGSLGANKALVIDTTAPTVTNVTSTSADGAYTTGALIPVTVTFSEPVTVIGTPQLTLETGTTDQVVDYTSGSGTATLTFNYTVQAGDNSADLDYISATALALNGGTIQDAATNDATLTLPAPGAAGSLGANKALVIDAVAPDTTITANPTNPTNNPNANFDFTGSDGSGTGVASFECDLDGGGFSACTSTKTYTSLADGSHTFQVRAIDTAGNVDSTPASFTWIVDTTAPTVAVSSVTTSPTNSSPIVVTITFSEPVTGFTASTAAGDLSITNGADSNPTGSGTTYTFDLTPSGQGPVTVVVPSGSAFDASTNPNTVSNTFSITYDITSPTVTINQAAGQADPTGTAPIDFTVVFDEPVASLTPANVTLGGTAPGALSATISGGPTTYNVAVSGMIGGGTVTADIKAGAVTDLAGNANAASTSTDNIVTFDPVVPVVTGIVRADPSPTNAASVRYTVTFSKNVSGVDAGDFSLATSGVTGAAITGIAGSGTTWTATVNTGSGSGTIGLNVDDNDSIVDLIGNQLGGKGAGNGNFTGEVYAIDKTAPQAGNLVAANVTTGGGSTQTFTIVFSDNLAIDIASLDGSDIRVTGPGGFNQPAALVSVTPATNGAPRTATYQISAPGGSWDNADNGAYTVALQANQVRDTAGNPVAASVLGTFSVNVSVSRRTVYLPLIFQSVAQAPDLVISSVTLTPNKTSFTTSEPVQISVVIKNQGNAPTTPFWVDLYLNPSRTPALNLIWSQVCSLRPCYGIAWQVTQPLAPGAELTLTSTVGSFAQGYTNWRERLAAGTTDLYVQADSWNPGKIVGASGDANLANNLFHIGGLHVTGQNVAGAGADVAIPVRPVAGQR